MKHIDSLRIGSRWRTMVVVVSLYCLGLALSAGACSDGVAGGTRGSWRAEVDTLGDTIVVRTLSGSEWGTAVLIPERQIGTLDGADHEIFGRVAGLAVTAEGDILLYDQQVPALRRFSADGQYLGTLGRSGSGPGEYANSDGGLAVLRDGRILLRDPGNARLTVYAPDGSHLGTWPLPRGGYTSTPIVAAADGGFYNPVWGGAQPMRMVRYTAEGTPVDSLPRPEPRVESATVRAQTEGASQTWRVPFSQSSMWTFHPAGYYLAAVSGQYSIDALRSDRSVLRLAKGGEPLPVTADERVVEEERVTTAMRRLDPLWRWNGPAIPKTKPLLRELYVGEDGRIWVLLHQVGERVPDDELDPELGGGSPSPQYREPTVFDVFEEDGRYLGRVSCPQGFSTSPRPVFRGDHVWALNRDKLGVQRVVRYRIVADRLATGPENK